MPIGYWEDAPLYERDLEEAKQFLVAQASDPPTELEYQVHGGDRREGDRRDRAGEPRRDRHHRHPQASSTRRPTSRSRRQELQSRELFYVGFITNPDPSWSTVWFVCDQIDVWNWMYWCDEEYDRLHYAAIQESDPAVRNDMYIEMQQLWDAAVAHGLARAGRRDTSRPAQGIQPALRPDGRIYARPGSGRVASANTSA